MAKPPLESSDSVPPPAEVVAGRYRIVSVRDPAGPLGATYGAVDLAGGVSAAPGGEPGGYPELTLRVLADPGSAGGASSLGEQDRAHFEQQAARLAAVRHPAVARTFELGLLSDLGVFLAREPVELQGQTLRDILAVRGGPLPEDEAIVLCAQIGEALEAAHQQGACHLGLSPACIYVYPDGSGVRLKVADFGLLPPAWAAQVGEAGYLAPEQVDGQRDGHTCDRRTDQFALAVILYEMLAGQPAFIAAAAEDRQIILGRVRNEDPLPLAQSRAVEQALARALSRSRAVRFSSVRDFMRALGADVSGWPVGNSLPLASRAPHGGRAPRVLLPMAVGALVSLAGLGGVVMFRHLSRPPAVSSRVLAGRLAAADLAAPSAERPASTGADLSASVDGASADGGVGADSATQTPDGSNDGLPDLRRSPTPTVTSLPHGQPKGTPTGLPGIPPGPDGPVLPPAAAPTPVWTALQFGGPEAKDLTEEQRAQLTSCVKMIGPRPPFQVWLQNINGILYVDLNRPSPQFSSSQDFRDCLKLRVKGKIVPKVLTITKMTKGKATP